MQVDINAWLVKYVHPDYRMAALTELRTITGVYERPEDVTHPGMSESAVQQREQYKVSIELDGVGWRNNVGAYRDDYGNWVRYGLANSSQQENVKRKSSDLIGLYPVIIQPHHVGHTFGRFWARECKEGDWVYSGTEHEQAQYRFIMLVNSLGGDAAFTNGKGTIR